VDDVPDGDDEVTRTDLPATREHTGPATDRVRIVGAEPAGEVTGELPVVRDVADDGGEGAEPELPLEGSLFDQPTVHLTDEPGDPGDAGPVVPWHPPSTLGQTTKYRSVSMGAPGPIIPSHQPAMTWPGPAGPAAWESPVRAWRTRTPLLRSDSSSPQVS